MKSIFVLFLFFYLVVCLFSFIALIIQIFGYVVDSWDHYFTTFMVRFRLEKYLPSKEFIEKNKSKPVFNYESGIFRLLLLILLILTDMFYHQVNGESMLQKFYNYLFN